MATRHGGLDVIQNWLNQTTEQLDMNRQIVDSQIDLVTFLRLEKEADELYEGVLQAKEIGADLQRELMLIGSWGVDVRMNTENRDRVINVIARWDDYGTQIADLKQKHQLLIAQLDQLRKRVEYKD